MKITISLSNGKTCTFDECDILCPRSSVTSFDPDDIVQVRYKTKRPWGSGLLADGFYRRGKATLEFCTASETEDGKMWQHCIVEGPTLKDVQLMYQDVYYRRLPPERESQDARVRTHNYVRG